jgi:hypothetical protein
VRRDKDPNAKASGGWLTINYSTYDAHVGFAADDTEAKRLKSTLSEKAFLPAQEGEVVRRGNAVYYSNRETMPSDMRENLGACLK